MNAVNHQPEVGLEADARALIEATLSLLQLSGVWPSFDELDKYADNRLGIPDAGEALTRISPSFVRGLHGLASVPGDRSVELTARAVALCPDGAELALAFTHAVAAAADAEEARLGGEPDAVLTPDEVAHHLPAAGRHELLCQLGALLAVERWGWSSASTDYPWSFTINRQVRRFRGISSIDDYLRRSSRGEPNRDDPIHDAVPAEVAPRGKTTNPDTSSTSFQILDVDDPAYRLRWPSQIVRDELERHVRRASRRGGTSASSAAATVSLLTSAFAGDSPTLDLRALLAHPDPWADPVYTEAAIEWIEQLRAELTTWAEPSYRPSFYSQRHRSTPRVPADRPDTLRRLATEIGSMADQGLFAERLGLWCPDAHDQPAPEDLFADILGRRIDEFSWPPSESLLLAPVVHES